MIELLKRGDDKALGDTRTSKPLGTAEQLPKGFDFIEIVSISFSLKDNRWNWKSGGARRPNAVWCLWQT